MKINIIDFTPELQYYIAHAADGDAEALWETLVLGDKWRELCRYSPFSLEDRKPRAIRDLDTLRRQTEIIASFDYARLQARFEQIAARLPNYDEDPISVGFIAADPANETVNRRQNGVAGTSLFGNILIQVNPLSEGYADWIGYVFAHEYHHTVWGNYRYNLCGAAPEQDLLQALIIDGQADSFARSLYPELRPQWLHLDRPADIRRLYWERYRDRLTQTEFDYAALMFGNGRDIPWCGGYAVGYYLIQTYLRQSAMDFRALIEADLTAADFADA